VILQRCISGTEFNVMGIGDGDGGVLGLCCVRKTIISEKGKGQGAMTVRDRALEEFAGKIIGDLKWRGPFEVEAMKDEDTGEFLLIEVNPRFPAWVDFSSTFGVNFPAALVRGILAGEVEKLPPCEPGNFFLRHFVEVHGRVEQLAAIAAEGDIARAPGEKIQSDFATA
jgi:carbamoyl-phosphate synthase large subunit